MNKLTAKQLLMLNRKIVEEDDEPLRPYRDMDVLERIAAIPYEKDEEFFYIYRDTIEKAAILGCSLHKCKAFADGNSETAALAMFTLLDINGYELVDFGNDLDELFEHLERQNFESVCAWIKEHLEDEIVK